MQIALIPPVELIGEFMHLSDMQLILPDPWIHSDSYRYHMDQFREEFKQYRILDNGAAEQIPVSDGALMHLIEMTKPDEFALPDVLGDAKATFERSMEFVDRYSERIKSSGAHVGFVAQGRTIDEAFDTVQDFVADTGDLVSTIFIPRLLTRNSPNARIDLAIALHSVSDLALHFFGMSENWPSEVARISRMTFNPVRSIDSAMPFYWGAARRSLVDGIVSNPPHRMTNYFIQEYDQEQLELTRANVNTVLGWLS